MYREEIASCLLNIHSLLFLTNGITIFLVTISFEVVWEAKG